MKVLKSTIVVSVLCTLSGCGMMSHHKAMGNPDQMFIMDAAMSSNAEIAASQLALKMSKKSDVRDYASMMINDHDKANQKLKPVASALGLTLPEMADPTHMIMTDHLAQVPAEMFDGEYLGQMKADHAMVVAKFEHASQNAVNPALKNYATMELPGLKHHKEMAEKLESKYSK